MCSSVDEVLWRVMVADGATRAEGEFEAEENEILLRENNPWHDEEVRMLEFRAVDAKVGDGRRVRENKGYLDDVVGARHGFSGGVVLAVVVIGFLLEEN
jgi:hypothetical protein